MTVIRVGAAPFNATGDGVTDDRAIIQSAIDAAAAAGGGIVELDAKRYALISGDLDIKPFVTLMGAYRPVGQVVAANYTTAKFALVLSSARSIILRASSAIVGITVVRLGLTTVTNLRTAIDTVTAFAGTAIRMGTGDGFTGGDGRDSRVERCAIYGFNQAILANFAPRASIVDVIGDNRNGIEILNNYDTARISRIHFWPFVTGNLSTSLVTLAVSGATNAAGLVRIVTSPHGLSTGDTVNTALIGGVPGANGRFVVTVINATTLDLQGSTFSGTYTSGGSCFISTNRRTGVGLKITNTDGCNTQDFFCFGYDTGILLGDAASVITLAMIGVDNLLVIADPIPVGIRLTGTANRAKFDQCFLSSNGTAIEVDTTSAELHQVSQSMIGKGGAVGAQTIRVIRGGLSLVGNDMNGITISVSDTAERLLISNSNTSGIVYTASAAAMNRVSLSQDVSNDDTATRYAAGQLEFFTTDSLSATGLTRRAFIQNDGSLNIERRSVSAGARVNIKNSNNVDAFFISMGTPLNALFFQGDPTNNPNPVFVFGSFGTATAQTEMQLRRLSASPANADNLGLLTFVGRNSAAADWNYANIVAVSDNVTAGSEAGAVAINTAQGASLIERFRVSNTQMTSTVPVVLPSYTVAGLPAASATPRGIIYVSNGTANKRLAVSDGTNWRWPDGAIVS